MRTERLCRRGDLQLTEDTAVSHSDRERKERGNLLEEGIVLSLWCACLALVLGALLHNYCRVWDVEYRPAWMFALFAISLAAALIGAAGLHWRPLPWIAAALLVAHGVRSWRPLTEGAMELANPVIRTWKEYYGMDPGLYSMNHVSKMEPAIFYAAAWLALFVTAAACRKWSRLFLALPALIMLAMPLSVGLCPDLKSCIGLCMGFLPAFALAGNIVFHRDDGSNARIAIGSSVLTLLICILGLGIFSLWGNESVTPAILAKHEATLSSQKELENRVRMFAGQVRRAFSSGGGSENGSISNDRLRHTGEEVFRVTVKAKPKAKFYFRGFVGAAYADGQWLPMAEDVFSDKLASWGYDGGDAGQVVLNRSYTRAEAVAEYTSMMSADRSGSSSKNRRDDVGFLTEMEIAYGKNAPEYALLPYYTNLYAESLGDFAIEADAVIRRPWEIERVKFATAELVADAGTALTAFTSHSESDDRARLMTNYESDVKKTYTKLPEQGLKRLRELVDTWREEGYGVESCDINYAIPIQKVTRELAGRTDYSTTPERLPDGADVVEYFLFDGKTGYCIHYASAATLLLRGLGVPARFVSGYAADPDAFAKNPDGTYTAVIKDEMGHAWTEVFTDTQGWIPVETTEGVSSMGYGMEEESLRMASAIRSADEERRKEAQEAHRQHETERGPDQNTQAPGQHNGGREQEGKRAVSGKTLTAFLVFLAVVLAAAVIWLICAAGRYVKHELRYQSPNTKIALAEVLHRIVAQSYRAGFIRERDLKDEDFLGVAVRNLNFLRDGELEKLFRTVQKSEFSDYVPTKEEVEAGKCLYRNLMVAVKNHKKIKRSLF